MSCILEELQVVLKNSIKDMIKAGSGRFIPASGDVPFPSRGCRG